MNKATSEGSEGKYYPRFKEEQLMHWEKSVFAKATLEGLMTKIYVLFLLAAKPVPSLFCLSACLHCCSSDLCFVLGLFV